MTEPVNLFDPEVRRNPYPTYARMREAPVAKVAPLGVWAVSRREDVLFALRHPEIFSSQAFQAVLSPAWLPESRIGHSLVAKDGPAHTKLRALLSRAFTPKVIAQLEPRVREFAERAADDMLEHEELDFIAAFAVRFPALVIAEILGLDPALIPRFGVWADHMAALSPVEPPPEVADAIRQTITDVNRYLGEVIAARRVEPRSDIISILTQAEIDGEQLDDEEILAFMSLLLPAGYETTRHLLANTMLCFLEHPEQIEAMRENPDRIPGFVEEVLRTDPSVHGVARITTQDVEIGGTTIPAGNMVFMFLGSTGHDPDGVEDPERFDPTREFKGLLAFGHGPHFCLGAPLARMEARVGIEVLIDRFRGFEAGSTEVTWNLSPTVRGPEQLSIRPLRA